MEGHTLVSLTTLRERYVSFPFDFWRYRQLADFVAIRHRNSQIRSNLTEFERLWGANDLLPHLISVPYKMLEATKSSPKPFFVKEWERELQCKFTDEQLHHLYHLTHTSSVDSKTQENNYKLLTRWYRVPSSLARIYPSTSDRYWRGCGMRRTLLHIWWECPLLTPFWSV